MTTRKRFQNGNVRLLFENLKNLAPRNNVRSDTNYELSRCVLPSAVPGPAKSFSIDLRHIHELQKSPRVAVENIPAFVWTETLTLWEKTGVNSVYIFTVITPHPEPLAQKLSIGQGDLIRGRYEFARIPMLLPVCFQIIMISRLNVEPKEKRKPELCRCRTRACYH